MPKDYPRIIGSILKLIIIKKKIFPPPWNDDFDIFVDANRKIEKKRNLNNFHYHLESTQSLYKSYIANNIRKRGERSFDIYKRFFSSILYTSTLLAQNLTSRTYPVYFYLANYKWTTVYHVSPKTGTVTLDAISKRERGRERRGSTKGRMALVFLFHPP